MNRRILALALILASVLAGIAHAQPAQPGDLLVASSTGGSTVLAVTPNANTSRTIASVSGAIRGVVVGPDNASYYAASGLSVFRITPSGTVTTVVATLAPGIGTAFADLDEGGQILVGTGWASAGSVFRVDATTSQYTTIAPTGIFANALCLDRDTGDVVVADTTARVILRIDWQGVVRTVQTGLPTVYAMDFHPQTGEVLIGVSNRVLRIDALNTMSTFIVNSPLAKSIAVLENGDVVVGPHGTTMSLYNAQGQLIGTPYNGPNITKMDMAVEDENNVWGLSTPVPGAPLSLSVRFARHPGKLFLAAASFSRSPGIPVDSRFVPLTIDNLFSLSLNTPALFQGFGGTLDSQGRAGMNVIIPNLPLRGIRMFFAAIVIDLAAPSGIGQISQPYGVTIR